MLTVFEGSLENQNDLIVLLADFGRFGWTQGAAGVDLRQSQFRNTWRLDENAQDAPFEFKTEVSVFLSAW